MTNKPATWRRVPIIDLCSEHVDCVNRTAPVVDERTPFKMIRTTNVRNGFIDTENVRYVTEPVYKKWTRRLVPKRGDVILTREAPLGDVGKLRTDDLIFLGQRLYHFRPDPKKLDGDFLLYSLMAPDLQGQIRGFGSGSTVEHMRLEDIPNLGILAPDVSVQRKIAAILSVYDDLIENNERRIKILEEMAENLYREWFVKFRFPRHNKVKLVDSPLGKIPQGWEVCKLGDRIDLLYGKALKECDRHGGTVPVYGSSGVVGLHDEAMAKAPGIVVGRKGNVGSVFWAAKDFWPIDTAYYVSARLDLHYMYWVLRHQTFINNDAAVPGLNRNAALAKLFLVPSDSLVQEFSDIVSPMSLA